MEELTLFWDGPFSQWTTSIFVVNGVEYNCAEQYMMAEKAVLFEDENSLVAIMEAEDPKTQKALGREVENFDVDVWQEDEDNGRPRCWNIVWRGNMAKFTQNPHLLSDLLATKGTVLVEASPYDCIWGIGWRATDPAAHSRETWRGLNWLGEVLTSVRSFLEVNNQIYDSSDDERCAG